MFERTSFSRWFAARPAAAAAAPPRGKAAIFSTCLVEHQGTAVGKSLVRVLERNGIAVSLPAQRCCGMPAMDGGDMATRDALGRREPRLPGQRDRRRSRRGRPLADLLLRAQARLPRPVRRQGARPRPVRPGVRRERVPDAARRPRASSTRASAGARARSPTSSPATSRSRTSASSRATSSSSSPAPG